LRIASEVTGEARGLNYFCQYRHELWSKHGLAKPPRRPQLDRYDGLVVVAGQENEGDAALAQGKGDREAPFAIQIDVEDGSVQGLVFGKPQGIGDPANRADDGTATTLEQIAHDLGGKEIVLHDQDPHSVEAFARLSHRA
jgi:hypothetical protein